MAVMMLTSTHMAITKFLIGGVLIVGVVAGIYYLGSSHGKDEIQAKWNVEKLAVQEEALRISQENAELEKAHRKEINKINTALDNATGVFNESLNTLAADYAKRLSDSEKRADRYREQAASGPVESANLASHAAKLDQSLEEGRQLVKEFRAVVELRDEQLIALGQQILADRAAIGN